VSTALTFSVSRLAAAAAARAANDGFLVLGVPSGDGAAEPLSESPGDGAELSGAALLGWALLEWALLESALLGCLLASEAVPPGTFGSAVCWGDADVDAGVGEGVGDPFGSAMAVDDETASVAMAPTRTARGRRCMCTRNHSGR
jgi:hypothetical protein